MKIAVYCSAKDQIPEEYLQLGDKLGEWIGRNGHEMVYGGATGGLMSRCSQSYVAHKSANQMLTGVIPDRIIRSGRQANHCDELVTVSNMSERKQQMREIADCFVCLPGSYGTLDEMMDVISSGVIGEHKKPCYVLNYEGFYNHLPALAEHMRELHFLPAQESYKPTYVNTLEELFEIIQSKQN